MPSVILKTQQKCDESLYKVYDERLTRLKTENQPLYEKLSDFVQYCYGKENCEAARRYTMNGKYDKHSATSFESAVFGDTLQADIKTLREYGLINSGESIPTYATQMVMQHRYLGGGVPKVEAASRGVGH